MLIFVRVLDMYSKLVERVLVVEAEVESREYCGLTNWTLAKTTLLFLCVLAEHLWWDPVTLPITLCDASFNMEGGSDCDWRCRDT